MATFSTLPSLGGHSQAQAVNEAGTVIVGQSFDRSDLLYAGKWTLQNNGSWALATLPWPPGVTATTARGVNNLGEAAGNDFWTTSRALLWSAAGGVDVLSCDTDPLPATANAISADAQVVVGTAGPSPRVPSVWQPGTCTTALPGGSGMASAGSGDGTIVGGSGSGVPTRWTNIGGLWQVEQLDNRAGAVTAANSTGDLAGSVVTSCALADGCDRAVVWYAAGGSQELGTLGGDHSNASGINANGEVVGISEPSRGSSTAFFWSVSRGMVQLPFKGRWAVAYALSDVRQDGTRLVVGANSQAQAIVWIVRNP